MKDKYFIDTNIFVYTFDKRSPKKNRIAHNIIKSSLVENNGCISYQVIQEFLNVSTKKFEVPITVNDSKIYLENVMGPICEVFTSLALYHRALDLMERWKYSFYDSLIIAAAIQSECTILYSEDMQHKQKIQSVRIINPFLR